ncbi:MAG: DUF1648 domain-containing protein [Cytophagales bacterium]|nr:DUF1648 domain-containing protein [Cytophagales bacterium]
MEKPRINPPLRKIDIIIEVLAGVCIIYMIVQLIIEYPGLEQKVPSHFGANGKPDAWSNKSSLLVMPVITIILYAGLTVLNRFPHLFNYPVPITASNAAAQYRLAKSLLATLKLTTTGLFLYIQLQTIGVARQFQTGLGTGFIIIALLSAFIPMIIYLALASKTRP